MSGLLTVVSGIDTGIGKSVATGLMARALLQQGVRAVTMKLVQTGSDGVSEDILEHRRLMGTGLLAIDHDGATCPYCFPFPASPHLSARLEGRRIDPNVLTRSAASLMQHYEAVLLEGAGGLLVPLGGGLLFADWVRDAGWPLVLVTSPRLGSINHTLLSLEACFSRGIRVSGIVYNRFAEVGRVIGDDSLSLIRETLAAAGRHVPVAELEEGVLNAGAGFLDALLHDPPTHCIPKKPH